MYITNWLSLSCAALPPLTVSALLNHFGDINTLMAADTGALQAAGVSPASIKRLTSPVRERVDRSLAWAEQDGHSLLCPDDNNFPLLLRQIPDPPPILYVCGQESVLNHPQLAIVGARNATHSALEITRDHAQALSGSGLGITSGLARGVDSAAHRGCLKGGSPTIAVAGCGADVIYPKCNQSLAQDIIDQGALISEFAPGTPPVARNFPRRNRIISGLSLGTLVVEAAQRSGTLVTARLAMEQNREVFAIPGSVRNPLTRGCHALIRQGATLVESPLDVLQELDLALLADAPVGAQPPVGDSESRSPETLQRELDPSSHAIFQGMGYEPVTVDILSKRCQLGLSELMQGLLRLELNGHIRALSDGRYVRC